jgi:hypothetical protein
VLSFEKLFTSRGVEGTNIHRTKIEAAKVHDPFKVLHKGKRKDGDEIFNDLIQYANSHNITFYPLDPDNYLRYIIPDITFDNYERADEIFKIKRTELLNLKYLASDTGGISLLGAKKFEKFQDHVQRDLSSYYELSYYPKRKKADGKYHKIEVKIKKPGVNIRFRKGYFDYKTDQKESLLFASTSSDPDLFKEIAFQARAVPFFTKKDKCILWINMALPVQELILGGDPNLETKILKAGFWVDEKENKAFNARVDIPFTLTPEFRHYFGYNTCSQEIELKPIKYRMIFTLYDQETSQVGAVEHELEIPDLKRENQIEVLNAVFGRLIPSKNRGKAFSISSKDGTLQLEKHRFFPMGSNQFSTNEKQALFLQILLPENSEDTSQKFILIQGGREQGEIKYELIKKSKNKKANLLNLVYLLEFNQFLKGDFTFLIKMLGKQNQAIGEKQIPIKIF